ncbi:MAG TPA: hypothetical protein DGT21_18185 [Armatimonadetes bacterium]|nr:hypothetical protein [Armatimonadota bacterium]
MNHLWLLGTPMPTPTAQRIGATGMPRVAERQAPVNDGPATTGARARDGWRLSWFDPLWCPLERSEVSIVRAQPAQTGRRQRPASMQTMLAPTGRARAEFTLPPAHPVLMGGQERMTEGGRGVATQPSAPRPVAGRAQSEVIDRHQATLVERAGQVTPVLGGTGVGVIFGGGGQADQNGNIWGPKAFRHHVLPCLQEIVKVCHAEQLRSVPGEDGNPWAVAADQSDASCVGHIGGGKQDAGMEPADRRKRRPDLTIWGSVSCGGTLPQRIPGQAHAEATLLMGGACPGGDTVPDCPRLHTHRTTARPVTAAIRHRGRLEPMGRAQ